MLKIVYPICCGMDVHKSFIVACIASTNEQGVTTYKSKRFSTFTGNLRRCAAWLATNNCKDVCMESTGKYWIPIYNILESTCNIVLAHPKYVKAIRGKKTDKRDAKWIADIFKHDLVAGSFIPPADIRQLRDLFRYRWKLTSFTTGEKNRAQNCLTVSNFKLDDVFSDVFGKAASAITSCILENPAEKITDVSGFRTKGMKATNEQVLAAVDGEMCKEQAEKLRTRTPPPYTEDGDLVIESVRRYTGPADKEAPAVTLDLSLTAKLMRFLQLQEQKKGAEAGKKEIEEDMKRLKAAIIAKMGKSCKAICQQDGVNYTVTYNPIRTPGIDKDNLKRLKLDHPDIYEQYVTVSVSRRFVVKCDAEAA